MGGKKLMGSLKTELEEFWGRSTAKKFFNGKEIVSSAHFDSVWWLVYKQAISKYPKTFRTFITKIGFWMVQLHLQTLALGREYHQQVSIVQMKTQDFKTSN
jgi:hypothetical protein